MEMTAAAWWSAIGQTALVVVISFVVLCVITSLVRFQLMTEAATEARELGMDEEKGFRLAVMNQIAKARKAREPISIALVSHPPDGAAAGDVEARLRMAIRATDVVMSCGTGVTGLLLLCGSDKAGTVVERIMQEDACGHMPGADQWRFGVAGYPEHGIKTSELYDRARRMMDEAAQSGQRIAGMATPEEVAEEKAAPAEIVDPLTGLVREEKMINTMRRYIAQARRVDQPASLVYLEIDQFARVTEGMKPGAADALIKELATFIDAQLREQDLLCRFGAAGFVIGLMIGPAQALAVVQRMAAAVRRNVFRTGNAKITLSAGVSGYPEVQGTAVQYFVAAEIALQQAKQRGRNQVVRYESSMQLQAQTATGIDRL